MNFDVGIVTGWSDAGGSTESYINLTNALNDRGISAVMIGPHKYHLNKCNGACYTEMGDINEIKNLIWHFGPFSRGFAKYRKSENVILSCHEMGLNPVFENYAQDVKDDQFNYFHFVSQHQMDFQLDHYGVDFKDNMVVIQNLLDPKLKALYTAVIGKIGGVIGSIDRNKRTHLSIQAALDDGCDMVRVFGKDTDLPYHMEYVAPMLKDPRVKWHGVIDDKSKMYASITDVYHYSNSETWGYIKAECQFLQIPFHSNNMTPLNLQSTDEIVNSWKEILV